MNNINKRNEHVIREVLEGSIADELEIEAGDILLKINDNEISDVFDYRYYIQDEYIEVLIKKANGEEWLLEIDKDFDEDLGVEFENSLMSEYRSCSNKCIFCFIDQMPPGMRETLYFKDDDSRLSFLQGNYITLTNMNESDVDRIIEMNLAPINISVHTTNPELRCKMLNNRFAGDKLQFIRKLYDNQVEMNGQIVLCKGVNDGAELERTIDDLSEYLPFMRSVSVVPAGITKYREGLYPLELFDSREAGQVIDVIEARQEEFYKQYGLHFIHASDEWYINAGRDFPEEERYDGYIQLENGVGMMRLFIDEVSEALEALKAGNNDYLNNNSTVTIPTGVLSYKTVKKMAEKVMETCKGIKVNTVCITNEFFGETITVTGLITGKDLISQLSQYKLSGNCLGDRILITSSMIRSGERVFLDDVTIDDVTKALGTELVMVDSSGYDFVESIINSNYSINRNNDKEVYVDAFDTLA